MAPWKAGLLGMGIVLGAVAALAAIGAIYGPREVGLTLFGGILLAFIAHLGWLAGVELWGRK